MRDADRDWMLRCARGQVDTPEAMVLVQAMHRQADLAERDPELAEALALGDRLDPRPDRWPAAPAPWDLPEPDGGWDDAAAAQTAEAVATSKLLTITLAEVAAERVRWLWPGYVPLGKLTILDGDPGLGKSTLALDLASRVSTGSPLPDKAPMTDGPANVVLMSAEDGLGDTIRPRVDAAGGDASRIDCVTEVVTMDDEGRPATRLPSLPVDVDPLERLVKRRKARLVIVDVLTAYLDAGVNSYRDQDVRRALHPLANMAERCGAAVVVLRHLNKSGGAQAIYRGGGSIGLSGAARSVLMVGREPDDEARCVLASVKSNLSARPASLAYSVVPDELRDTGRIAWLGQVTSGADDLVGDPNAAGAIEDAMEFLRQLLLTGPVPAKEAVRQATDNGISESTLRRAKKRAGVASRRVGFGAGSSVEWAIGGHRPPYLQKEAYDHVRESGDHSPSGECSRCGAPTTDISGICATCARPAGATVIDLFDSLAQTPNGHKPGGSDGA